MSDRIADMPENTSVQAEENLHELGDSLRTLYEEKLKNKHGVENGSYRAAMAKAETVLQDRPGVIRLDHHKIKEPDLMKELTADNRFWDPEWTAMLYSGDSEKLFEELSRRYWDDRKVGEVRSKDWVPVCVMEDVNGKHMPALYIIKADSEDIGEVTDTMKMFQDQILKALPEKEEVPDAA